MLYPLSYGGGGCKRGWKPSQSAPSYHAKSNEEGALDHHGGPIRSRSRPVWPLPRVHVQSSQRVHASTHPSPGDSRNRADREKPSTAQLIPRGHH